MRGNRVKPNCLSSLELSSTCSFFDSLIQDWLAVWMILHFAVPRRRVMQGTSCNERCSWSDPAKWQRSVARSMKKIKKWDSKHSYIGSTSPESRWVDYFIFFRLHNCRWSRFQSSAQRANDHVHCYPYCTVKCLSLKHHNGELLPSPWFKAKCSILHYSWIKRVCIMCCHSPADIR